MFSSDYKQGEIPKKIWKKIVEIKEDNVSGSVKLTLKSVDILIQLIENYEFEEPESYKKTVFLTARRLTEAQPLMASIFNLSNEILLFLDGKDKNLEKNVLLFCKDFKKKLKNTSEEISKNAQDLIKDGNVVLTHSYSSTVLDTLVKAKFEHKNFEVICTESRPMKEGVNLSKKLADKNIPVTLIVDSAFLSFFDKVDLVLVGGDAITNKGLLNKIGTYSMALASKKYNKDFYALCGTQKIIPQNYDLGGEQEKKSEEILSKQAKGVTPVNFYFEYTPLAYVTGVVSELGILNHADIKNRMKNKELHDIFN